MFGLGLFEVLVILLVALIVIGPRRLPEVARTIAKTMRELRRASSDLRRSFDEVVAEPPPTPPRTPAPMPPGTRGPNPTPPDGPDPADPYRAAAPPNGKHD